MNWKMCAGKHSDQEKAIKTRLFSEVCENVIALGIDILSSMGVNLAPNMRSTPGFNRHTAT